MKKIYGLGTGPGAEDMLTLRAVKVLENADYIFAPFNKGKNMALDTVERFIENAEVVPLDFPMGKVTEEHYINAAKLMEDTLEDGESGVFITIGDVMFYSTVINTLEHFTEDVEVEFVPGIPSAIAAASSSKVPLAFVGESFMVIDHIPDIVDEKVGTMAILKTFKLSEEDLDKLEDLGFDYTYVQRASFDEEKVLTDKNEILNEKDYISLILARRKQ